MAKIELKAINDLLNSEFYIPDFQRGYRWGKNQVQSLLNDIFEFQCDEKGEKEIYCLQPLVVKRVGDKWHVIDGQQRLTTLKIILMCLSDTHSFNIEYETRKGSKEYLDKICKEENLRNSNPDYYYMYNAMTITKEWITNKINDAQTKEGYIETILKKVQFVWYETEEEDIIKVFTRINKGKIGLTEAELIKALFLNDNNFENKKEDAETTKEQEKEKMLNQLEIANEWDQIENRLQDDRFWLFFHFYEEKYEKPTRIDYILEIANQSENEENYKNNVFPIFENYYNSFKEIEKNKVEFVNRKWKDIRNCYRILEEWYNDEELFHYIGFLCAIEKDGKKQKELLGDLFKRYKKNNKREFLNDIKERVKKACKDCSDLRYQYDIENHRSKAYSRPLLLLHNVQTIIDQNKIIAEEKKYALPDFLRFPFHLFNKENWDVEHIRPNNLQQFVGERNKSARKKYVYLLEKREDAEIKEAIDEYKKDVQELGKNEEQAFVRLIEKTDIEKDNPLDDEQKNMIWNYVLLDSSTNREYGNSCFAIKRDYVLKKENGIKPQLKIVNGEVEQNYENEAAFVPICTRRVFSKEYSKYPDNLESWTIKDAALYRLDIEKRLWWVLSKNKELEQEKKLKLLDEYEESISNETIEDWTQTFYEWIDDKGKQDGIK